MQTTAHTQRLDQLRARLSEHGVEGMLIGSPSNRRWLSGFTGSAGWLLITQERALLGTDFRYWEQAEAQAPAFELFKLTSGMTQQDLVRSANVNGIGLESQHVTLKEFQTLSQVEDVNWVQTDGVVEALRIVKDAEELAAIRAAAAITDQAMGEVRNMVRVGMSELELAWELEKFMREAGATGLAFSVHVATGPNAALAHHAPGDRRIQDGDIVLVDMGASLHGYASDLTRTYLLADAFDPLFAERYELVLKAHDAAIEAIRPGCTGGEIDAVARDMISAAGYGDAFGHGLGHGLGLEIHEAPRLSPVRGDTSLAPGMVTTVEPGVYIPGWGGIRIEDLVAITEDGVELLSHCPHEPLLR